MNIKMTAQELEQYANVVSVLENAMAIAKTNGSAFIHVGNFPVQAICNNNRMQWFYWNPSRKKTSLKTLRIILTFQCAA